MSRAVLPQPLLRHLLSLLFLRPNRLVPLKLRRVAAIDVGVNDFHVIAAGFFGSELGEGGVRCWYEKEGQV